MKKTLTAIVAAGATFGMLAVPSVGKAESADPVDLVSHVNGQRCLEATTFTLYVAESVNDCYCEEKGHKQTMLEAVVETLHGKGYQIRKGGTIKAPEEPYLGQTPGAKSAGARVIVIPHKEQGKCEYALVAVEDSGGDVVVSDQIRVISLTGHPLPVRYLGAQLYNLFPTSCPTLRKQAEEERKKAGPQPELKSRCEGENDTPSYTPSPKDAKAGSLEKEMACLLAYQTKVLTSCHGVKLPGDDTIPRGFAEVWDMKVDVARKDYSSAIIDHITLLNYCIKGAGETMLGCLEDARK